MATLSMEESRKKKVDKMLTIRKRGGKRATKAELMEAFSHIPFGEFISLINEMIDEYSKRLAILSAPESRRLNTGVSHV